MLSVVGCGQSGDRASGGTVCTISDFTTEIHEYIRPALGHDANFFSFTVEPGDFCYDVGYAVIEEGVRTDYIQHTFDPTDEYYIENSADSRFSFLMTGGVFTGEDKLRFGMAFDNGSYTRPEVDMELPNLSGFAFSVRPERFKKSIVVGEEIVLAYFVGSIDGGVHGIDIGRFDQYKTIGEAMSDPDVSDNPFHLIFYVSAVSGD